MAKKKVINNKLNSDLIGQNFTNVASETIFNFGNFKLTTNFTGKENRDYSNELSSFVTPITLDSLGIDEGLSDHVVDFTNNATLNLDHSDIKSYVRFGSTRELLRVSIENIIELFPASLYIDSNLETNAITIENYTYDSLTNKCFFRIPVEFIVNKFGLVFDINNFSVPELLDIKNLNLSFSDFNVWREDDPTNETHTILGFTGDSSGVPYLKVEAIGDPFSDITGGTGNTSYHLKPQPKIYNKYKLELDQLETYIIDNRKSDRKGYIIKLKEPNNQASGEIIYTNREYVWQTSDGYNIDIDTSDYQRFLEAILNLGDIYDQAKTDLIARFLTPESLKLYDLTDEGKMTKLLRIYGAEFDEIRTFIDGIARINKVTYNKNNNVPDQLVKNLAKTLGWDPFVLIDQEQFVNSFVNLEVEDNQGDLLPAEVDIELWRRILINTNYFWKTKGTSNALKSMLMLIGIPEPFINITEYLYTVEGRIDPNTVELTLDDLPSASLPYDSEGYPIAPVETNDFYFQLSGNTDGGQTYIDLYRNVGFNVNRIVDNKKSWAASGFTERIDESTPNYFQQDNRLLINTKEVDVTLDIARGIEYDVYCYNKNVDDPFTSSGVTRPWLFVNIPFDFDVATNTFTIPETPLTGSTIQVNFNGITLTESGTTVTSGDTGTTIGDYIRISDTEVELLDETAMVYSNGTKDIITLTYLFDKLGFTGSTEVQYIVQKPVIGAGGTELYLAEEPKGDIQLVLNGISLTKDTSLFTGDFVLDATDPTKIIIQNTDLQLYLQTNPVVRVWCIKDGGTATNTTKKSEMHRVDAIPSSRVGFNHSTNQYFYVMTFKAFDIDSIKLTLNGITLQNGVDFTLDTINHAKVNFNTTTKINFGDMIGVYYVVADPLFAPPILPYDPTFPPIADMSFLEYLELINRRLINVKNRKTISDHSGGYYPTVLQIYEEYIKRSYYPDSNPLKSNGYNFGVVYPFLERYNSFFNRFIDQLLPATIIIRKGGIMVRNTSFTKQKFMYRRGVNFNESLQYLGDNGALYKKTLPTSDCNWTDDYVCVSCDDFAFIGDPSVLCEGMTTTTTTLPATTTTTTLPVATTTTTSAIKPKVFFGIHGNEPTIPSSLVTNNGVAGQTQYASGETMIMTWTTDSGLTQTLGGSGDVLTEDIEFNITFTGVSEVTFYTTDNILNVNVAPTETEVGGLNSWVLPISENEGFVEFTIWTPNTNQSWGATIDIASNLGYELGVVPEGDSEYVLKGTDTNGYVTLDALETYVNGKIDSV